MSTSAWRRPTRYSLTCEMMMAAASLCQTILILCLIEQAFGLGSITFMEQPGDTSATEGEMVPCYCTYTGTVDLPLWKINGSTYTPNQLPPAFLANSSGLFFVARLEFSYTAFQCFFNVYTSSGQFQLVESEIGTVLVKDVRGYEPPEFPRPPCTEKPNFTGILIDPTLVLLYWKKKCTNSTDFFDTYAMCNDSKNILERSHAQSPLRYETQVIKESTPLFQLIVNNGSEITSLSVDRNILEEQTDVIVTVSDARIPIGCISGQFCIFLDPSNMNGQCIETKDFKTHLPPGYHACGEELNVCIENITQEMNETLYTVMCHRQCCTDVSKCLVVMGSSKLIIGGPPLQPGTPCLFFNITHVAICLKLPFSHFNIDRFMLNTDLCGSYNLTLEELCKPFPFWSNCTPTEFTVVAYSAAGASVPSAAVFVNATYSSDSEKQFQFFCKCVAALIPSMNLRLKISPQDSSTLIIEVTTPDSLPPAVRLDLCSNNANISIIAEEQRECREMYDWNGTCSDTGTTSIGRVQFSVPERCSNEDGNYTLVASVPLVINGATEIPCYFLETNLSLSYGNIEPSSDETDDSFWTKVIIGIGGTIGGLLFIPVLIVIGGCIIWYLCRHNLEHGEYRPEEEEKTHGVKPLDDPVAEGPH